MRALLVLLSAVFMLSACSKEVKVVSASGAQEPLRVEESANVEMRFSEADLARFVDVQAEIWKAGRNAGLIKVFNQILNKDLLIVPTVGAIGPGELPGTYRQQGALDMTGDAETGDVVQSFLITTRFVGDLSVGGQIVSIEEGRYIAGLHDISYAMLYQTVPSSLPSCVAIAEPVGELGSSFFRVIGVAVVKQLMQDTVALPKQEGGATGTLCSLEIVVSDREVEAGDRVFLMDVDVAALDEGAAPLDGEPETVVVLPPHRDTVQEPKEKK